MSSGMNGTTSRGVFKSIAKAQAADLRDGVVVWISGGRSYDIKSTTVNADFVLSNGNGAFIRVSETIAASSEIEWDFEVVFNDGVELRSGYGTRNIHGNKSVDFSRASTTYSTNKSGVIESLAVDVPSIVKGGLEAYESAINRAVWSEDFTSGSWAKNAATVSGNSAISPDGSLNADVITFTNVGGYVRQFFTGAGDTNVSVWIRSNTVTEIGLNAGGTSGVVQYTIGAKWSRIDLHTDVASGTNFSIIAQAAFGDVELWGAQITDSVILLPYKKTEASAESKSPDIATFPMMGNMPSAGNSFSIETDCNMGLGDAFSSPFHSVAIPSGAPTLSISKNSNGTSGFVYGQITTTDGDFFTPPNTYQAENKGVRFTLVYDSGLLSLSADGVNVGSVGTTGVPVYDVNSVIAIGRGNTKYINAPIKAVRIKQSALTVDQIAARGGYNA